MQTLIFSLLSFVAGGGLISLVHRAQISAYRRYTLRLRQPAYPQMTLAEWLEVTHNVNLNPKSYLP